MLTTITCYYDNYYMQSIKYNVDNYYMLLWQLLYAEYKKHTKNVYLNPKPPRNDHQVNQTQRSPIKGKTSDVKIKMKNKSSQDLKSGS